MNFLQGNDNTRRFRRMCTELGECRIAPIRDVYHLATLRLHLGCFDQLQHVEPLVVEKESVLPKHFRQLRNCRMIIGKYLGVKLT